MAVTGRSLSFPIKLELAHHQGTEVFRDAEDLATWSRLQSRRWEDVLPDKAPADYVKEVATRLTKTPRQLTEAVERFLKASEAQRAEIIGRIFDLLDNYTEGTTIAATTPLGQYVATLMREVRFEHACALVYVATGMIGEPDRTEIDQKKFADLGQIEFDRFTAMNSNAQMSRNLESLQGALDDLKVRVAGQEISVATVHPRELWRIRARSYSRSYFAIACLILASAGAVGAFIYQVEMPYFSDRVAHYEKTMDERRKANAIRVIAEGPQPSASAVELAAKNAEASATEITAMIMLQLVPIALSVFGATLFVWYIRILLKLMFAARAARENARERVIMIETVDAIGKIQSIKPEVRADLQMKVWDIVLKPSADYAINEGDPWESIGRFVDSIKNIQKSGKSE